MEPRMIIKNGIILDPGYIDVRVTDDGCQIVINDYSHIENVREKIAACLRALGVDLDCLSDGPCG